MDHSGESIEGDQASPAVMEEVRAILRSGGRPLSHHEVVEFICRPVLLGPSPDRTKKAGRPNKRTALEDAYYRAYLRRRGLFHLLVRLEKNRPKAAATRKRAGNPSREIVFALATEATLAGCRQRLLRRKIKALAAARGITIPADWQLGKLIGEFLKVDTTA